MKVSTAIGCVVALCAAFVGNVNAASYIGQLDLTDFAYPVTVNGFPTHAAANVLRFDLGSGWTGEMELLLTTSNYDGGVTTLGFALATDPNNALYSDPSPFLGLADATSQDEVTAFFDDNVIGWKFYGYGYPYISPGVTSNLTDTFDPPLQFDPNLHYYAFIAGAAAYIPTTVDVGLEVSSVPIPAAVWLFGSGIVGLIGASKRKRA